MQRIKPILCLQQGDVLEVSAGTGRNLPYYNHKQLSSLTLTDSSKYMLWHAAEKHRDRQAAKAGSLPVRFFLSDAQQLACQQQPGAASAAQHPTSQADGPAQQEQQRGDDGEAAATSEAQPVSTIFETRTQAFPERSFDSVVDTFGLCSHGDPVAVLKVPCAYALYPVIKAGLQSHMHGMQSHAAACQKPVPA